jgi:two-component system, LuxR family, response regulator FixJ
MASPPTSRDTDNEMFKAVSVAIIDDDERLRDALVFQLATAGFQCAPYPSPESFLSQSRTAHYDCIIADIFMPRMNGLQLVRHVKQAVPFASLILITGHGDMSIGVEAMRQGAIDCMEKPLDQEALTRAILRGTNFSRTKRLAHQRHLELRKREDSLTPREREIFTLIATGMLNKQIGYQLGPTEWTVKKHRGRIMKKMGAGSLADLVRMADALRDSSGGV